MSRLSDGRPVFPTAFHTIGPFFPEAFTDAGHADLTEGGSVPGEGIFLCGRVTDGNGDPVENALVEIWQADARGDFPGTGKHARRGVASPHDRTEDRARGHSTPAHSGSPTFRGWGRCATDANGNYRFHTIRPGGYPVLGVPDWVRPPHFRVRLLASGIMRPLLTEVFLPGEPLNDTDRQLLAITDADLRERLIAVAETSIDGGSPTFRFDVHLGGPEETPFLETISEEHGSIEPTTERA